MAEIKMADLMQRQALRKIMAYARGFLPRKGINALGPIKVYGKVLFRNHAGSVTIGRRSTLWPNVVFDFDAAPAGTSPKIEIGECTALGDRTEIHCGRNVKIGNHVAISWDCVIMESDYHAAGGSDVVPRPIVIEDESWIGCRVIILKGVTVGRGAIIGAGSVVTKDVPPYTLAAGNPARVIKSVEPWTGRGNE